MARAKDHYINGQGADDSTLIKGPKHGYIAAPYGFVGCNMTDHANRSGRD
ncbi:MAG: hypothetical protein P8I83_11490 [Paracoccaceae bacterium]|nr:hypothetical protein [Paracoccaceae bacterium]